MSASAPKQARTNLGKRVHIESIDDTKSNSTAIASPSPSASAVSASSTTIELPSAVDSKLSDGALATLLLHHAVSTAPSTSDSKALGSWLSSCPDIAAMKRMMDIAMWKLTKHRCEFCEKMFPRYLLRENRVGPVDDDNLVCKDCWEQESEEYAVDGTVGDPSFRSPPWPDECEPDIVPVPPLPYGRIVDPSGHTVGVVQQYQVPDGHGRGHFGKVTLFGFPKDSEFGSLDSDCSVVELSEKEFRAARSAQCYPLPSTRPPKPAPPPPPSTPIPPPPASIRSLVSFSSLTAAAHF
jgi:hypothetical protein